VNPGKGQVTKVEHGGHYTRRCGKFKRYREGERPIVYVVK